jgi:Ca2+-binding EF-hand superfamily protein
MTKSIAKPIAQPLTSHSTVKEMLLDDGISLSKLPNKIIRFDETIREMNTGIFFHPKQAPVSQSIVQSASKSSLERRTIKLINP